MEDVLYLWGGGWGRGDREFLGMDKDRMDVSGEWRIPIHGFNKGDGVSSWKKEHNIAIG
jgi:hypothetical protein